MGEDRLPSAEYGSGASGQSAAVAFLRRPASYPEKTDRVEVKETHMSWVFLTDRHAYKLKKPVRNDFLDFGTAALRRHFCEEELRLNRRLAPEVYLEVVPLTAAADGSLQLGGSGRPVDWLVKMRRLRSDRMLDNAIRAATLLPTEIDALAGCLTAFYRSAPRIGISDGEYRRRMHEGIEANRVELARCCPPSMAASIRSVTEAQEHYVAAHPETFDRRTEKGCIVEGHGDLRPEHVYLGPPPQIIDCLEFNRGFRSLDIADDLALLAVECDQLGAPEVGTALFRIQEVNDAPPDLIAFYKSYRATLRAKLAIWHLKDAHVADPGAWEDRAGRYLDLADRVRRRSF